MHIEDSVVNGTRRSGRIEILPSLVLEVLCILSMHRKLCMHCVCEDVLK
eukprot:SAG11_NODE_1863_length_4154_cov_3.719359_1_plen_49_part_00